MNRLLAWCVPSTALCWSIEYELVAWADPTDRVVLTLTTGDYR